jgi:hypothetical protein
VRWHDRMSNVGRLLPALLMILVVSPATVAQVNVTGVVKLVGVPNVWGQSGDFNPYTNIWAFFPPNLGNDNMYVRGSVMTQPSVAGVSQLVNWSMIETVEPDTNPCPASDLCQPDPMIPGMYHHYSWSIYDASSATSPIVQWFGPFVTGGSLKKVNLLISGESSSATNVVTPHYVTSASWYNLFTPQEQDVINALRDCMGVPWTGTDLATALGTYTVLGTTVMVNVSNCCSVTAHDQSSLLQNGDLVWVTSAADPGLDTGPAGSTITVSGPNSFIYTPSGTPGITHVDLQFINAAQSWAVPYEYPYMSALKAFWAAVVAHYGPSYTIGLTNYFSQLNYFRFGGSAGSEWYPYCVTGTGNYLENLPAPYTYVMEGGVAGHSVGWVDYYTAMGGYLQSLDPAVKIVHSINGAEIPENYCYADDEAEAAVTFSNRFGVRDGFGSQGLSALDHKECTTGPGCSYNMCNTRTQFSASDWYPLFATYGASGVPLELQPESLSYEGDTDCSLPTCGVGGGNYSGDLPTFLYPFATNDGVTDVEIYWRDLELAYDSTNYCYLSGTSCQASMSISLGGQIGSAGLQYTFFQKVGQGSMGTPVPCTGPLQTGATGNCAYAVNINAAAGPH